MHSYCPLSDHHHASTMNTALIYMVVLVACTACLSAQSYEQISTSRQQSESKVSYLLLKNMDNSDHSIYDNDPYAALAQKELQQYWSEPREDYVTELQSLQFLLSHLGHVTVHVVLVGNYPASLSSQIYNQLSRTVHLPYMATVTAVNATFYPSHRRFHYQVTARDSNSELFRAIQDLHDTQHTVQQSQIDHVLAKQSRDTHVSTVYLFMNDNSQSHRSYVLTNQRCAGIMWTRERDLFVDLRALSRASSGPRHAGEGVHEHVDLPNLDTTLLARYISTLVARLIDQFIVPRVYFKPLITDLKREIQVVVLHVTQSRDDSNSLKFDATLLQTVLTDPTLPKLGNNVVQVSVVRRNLQECEICRRLQRSALKHTTSAYLDSSGTVHSSARQYFDSHVIREFVQRHWTALSGQQSRDQHVLPVVVLETEDHVLLMDSDHVTRNSWSHVYPNMVIAIQPRDTRQHTDLDHTCDGSAVVESAYDTPTRAVLGACLRLIWGLVPEYLTLQLTAEHQLALQKFQSHMHEILHIETRKHVTEGASHTVTAVSPKWTHDWLMARVPSIFSSYAPNTRITQLQMDAAHINHVIHLTDHVFEQINAVSHHLTLLTGVIDASLTQRVNLMLFKLKLAFQFSEQLKFRELTAVLTSILGHDLRAVHDILHDHVPHEAVLTLDRCHAPLGGISLGYIVLAASCLFWLLGAVWVSRSFSRK